MIKRIKNKLESIHTKRVSNMLRKHFVLEASSQTPAPEGESRFFFEDAVYKDENWNYIKNLYPYRKSLGTKHPLTYEDNPCELGDKGELRDGVLEIHAEPRPENWLCFYHPEGGADFKLSFDICPKTVFKEVQMGFCYRDLGNRLRFLIRNNKEAVFECVYKGEFYNNLYRKPFSFTLGETHHVEVMSLKGVFTLTIDGETLFCVRSDGEIALGDRLVLFFYHPNEESAIRCTVKNAVVTALK